MYRWCSCFIVAISITEWFDEIRTHPHIRSIIEKVTTMDPSDYLLSPSDWHTKLLSYTDVVDRKLQQMTQQPHFRAARDWLHATIQNVSCAFTILFMLDQTQPCCGRRRFHIDTKDPLRGSSSPFSAFSRRG